MVLMLMSYKHDGVNYDFIYDLNNQDQMDKLHRTLIWAANKGVIVTLRSTKHAQATVAA